MFGFISLQLRPAMQNPATHRTRKQRISYVLKEVSSFDTYMDTGKISSSPSPKTPFLCTSYAEDIIFLPFPTGMLGAEC